MIAGVLVIAFAVVAEPPVVTVDRDDVEITASCIVRVAASPIADPAGDGVIRITADDVHVTFETGTVLRGAPAEAPPDTLAGVGIRITGRRVRLEGAAVTGYQVGIHASDADGLVIAAADVSGNFRQRLRSTSIAEDNADWLWPHVNDEHEWRTHYGAGLCVERSAGVEIHDVRARRGQNGIILDRVDDSKIYDNDCSFLSGWGLAMWRSTRNTISRNAFDFCVRGYSHGVYNRGQDSAGILLFEQCSANMITENSATHGGDGFFGFAGREALGEASPRDDRAWYERRGNNDNVLIGNDFSDAAAHGIEMTFSFGNVFAGNRLARNGICGIWGGYSQDSTIAGNTFEENGQLGYGLERGGVNIEHGTANIRDNTFRRNRCGVHLWWDDDARLLETPWAAANHERDLSSVIMENRFEGDELAIHLRQTGGPTHVNWNTFTDVGQKIEADAESPVTTLSIDGLVLVPAARAIGDRRPVGARAALRGREHIVMTEWGPYEWDEPRFVFDGQRLDGSGRPVLVFRLLGPGADDGASVAGWRARHGTGVEATIKVGDVRPGVLGTMHVTGLERGVHPVHIEYGQSGAAPQRSTHTLVWADWKIRHFPSAADPRTATEAWRAAAADALVTHRPHLFEPYGGDGPGAGLPADHFGTIATTTLAFPAGRWRLRTTSDDGVRAWVDGDLLIDDWTWHPPQTDTAEWTVTEPREITIRVEHFELDGYAVLSAEIEAIAP